MVVSGFMETKLLVWQTKKCCALCPELKDLFKNTLCPELKDPFKNTKIDLSHAYNTKSLKISTHIFDNASYFFDDAKE